MSSQPSNILPSCPSPNLATSPLRRSRRLRARSNSHFTRAAESRRLHLRRTQRSPSFLRLNQPHHYQPYRHRVESVPGRTLSSFTDSQTLSSAAQRPNYTGAGSAFAPEHDWSSFDRVAFPTTLAEQQRENYHFEPILPSIYAPFERTPAREMR